MRGTTPWRIREAVSWSMPVSARCARRLKPRSSSTRHTASANCLLRLGIVRLPDIMLPIANSARHHSDELRPDRYANECYHVSDNLTTRQPGEGQWRHDWGVT